MIKEGRHYFARSTVSEDISKRNQDINEFLQIFFEKIDLKLKGVASDNSQVSIAYYSTKTRPSSKHGKHVIEEEDETKSRPPTASNLKSSYCP